MKLKRFLAGVLTAAMVLTSLPVTAFAEENEQNVNPVAGDTDTGAGVAAPNGRNQGYVTVKEGTSSLWGEYVGTDPKKSFRVDIYAGSQKIATASLNNVNNIINDNAPIEELTWSIPIKGSSDQYWATAWVEPSPVANMQPTNVITYVDDQVACENIVSMSRPDGINPVIWSKVPGVKVAQVGNEYYTSLKEAVENAGSGATVKLLGDVDESDITVAADQNITIDLGGNTVNGDFMVYGKATIKNGDIVNTAFVSGIESNGASADLTVEDLDITSDRHAIRVDGGKATIKSGTYTSTVDGSSCYPVNAGGDIGGVPYPTELNIQGGTFHPSKDADTHGTSIMLKNKLVTTTISGGTFNTASNRSVENYGKMTITDGKFYGTLVNTITEISGGTFETKPDLKDCADGYAPLLNADGWYEVIEVVDYTIKYELNGGAFAADANPAEKYTIKDADITLLTPARTGYTFEGWTDKDGETVTEIKRGTTTGNKTFYANWEPITYTIQLKNGEETREIPVKYDESVEIAPDSFTAPEVEGKTYYFAGWSTAEDNTVEYPNGAPVENLTATGGETVTLYAVWAAEEVPELELQAQTKTYNGQTQAFALNVSGYDIAYLQNGVAAEPQNAGTYDVKISKGTYEYVFEGGLVIEKVTLTARYVSEIIRVGRTPSLFVEVTGFVNDETAATAAGYKAPTVTTNATDIGTYTLTPSGGAADNYTFAYESGTLTIKKKSSGGSSKPSTETGKEEKPEETPVETPEETPAETPAEEGVAQESVILTIGNVVAMVDGMPVVNDVAPIIRDSRTMLPIRFVAEALGADVAWDDDADKVTITKGDVVIEIFIGQPFALVNGNPVQLDAPAFIENGRTYLPLRFVAEVLGATVLWDANTNTVTIIPNK